MKSVVAEFILDSMSLRHLKSADSSVLPDSIMFEDGDEALLINDQLG